ncbi:hypothetical protein HSB1_47670 [Halogranum salarium B-1]|uniref:Uncharacterized protein n=1 Tax=Halogranum salarium B-1 TaxID=1210908 RepID=J2Z8K6_9EURY|nr:hypothetical protein HSB1_47670 [Halogranum salarium B-1]
MCSSIGENLSSLLREEFTFEGAGLRLSVSVFTSSLLEVEVAEQEN